MLNIFFTFLSDLGKPALNNDYYYVDKLEDFVGSVQSAVDKKSGLEI